MNNKNNYIYYLNAVHYCLFLGEKLSNNKVNIYTSKVIYYLSKTFSFENYYKTRKEKLDKDKNLEDFMYGEKVGFSIGWANHWFGYFYSCYSAFIAFIVVGIANRLLGKLDMFLFLLFFGIPIGILYIPAYRAVFSGDKYLKYFKEFEKKDDQWHKKWKRITIAFCVGSIISAVAGFFCMAVLTSI